MTNDQAVEAIEPLPGAIIVPINPVADQLIVELVDLMFEVAQNQFVCPLSIQMEM